MVQASPPQEIIQDWRKKRKKLASFRFIESSFNGREAIAHWSAYQAWLLYGKLLDEYSN
jgi:hypothetical protein